MAGGQAWRINQSAADVFTSIDKRLANQERRASPLSGTDLLGPGMSARAIQILDWNSEEATFNGYFWSIPGALHSPDPLIPWTGHVIAKDDGSGLQQVWNVDIETGIATWMRTWTPNPDGDGEVVFTEWRKFATSSGLIGVPEIDQPVLDDIEQALDDAASAFEFAEQSNRVFRQDEPPVSTEDYTLRVNDVWYDTNNGNSIHLWSGSAWVGGDNALFVDLDLAVQQAQADATQALADAAEAWEAAQGAGGSGNRIFRQVDAPVSDSNYTLQTNDVWYASGDGNRIRVWDGDSWESNISAYLATTNGKVEFTPGGLIARDASDVETLFIDASTGSIAMSGAISTGGEINGATVTGGIVQTEDTLARGVKMSSVGLIGYNAAGTATFSIDAATGAVAMLGSLTSGSTIAGATLTGVLQTSAAANTGVKISNSGIYVYNTSGGLVMSALNNGSAYFSGSLASGTFIDSPILTGGTVQTQSGSGGVKMTSSGLIGYDSGGSPKFVLSASTGAITSMTVTAGSISGTTITGGTISGATITGTSLTTPNTSGAYVTIGNGGVGGRITFYSASSSGGYIEGFNFGGQSLSLVSANVLVSNVLDVGTNLDVGGTARVGGLLTAQGGASVQSGLTITGGGLTVNAGGILAGGTIEFNSLEGSGARTVVAGAGGVLSAPSSSMRYKENAREFREDAALRLLDLKPYVWQYRDRGFYGDRLYGGFSAEQTHEAGLSLFIDYDNEGRPDNVRKEDLIAPLVLLVQRQERRIRTLEELAGV
jgi:hypothetical protein